MNSRTRYITAALLSRLTDFSYSGSIPKSASKSGWQKFFNNELSGISVTDAFDDIFELFCETKLFRPVEDEFAPTYFVFHQSKAMDLRKDPLFKDVSERYGALGHQWLIDAIRSITEVEKEETKGLAETTRYASASNRIVSFSHNQEELNSIDEQLGQLLKELEKNNEFNTLPIDQKDAVVADITVGRELINQKHFWLRSLWQTLMQGLRYLAKKFTDSLIGKLASALLEILAKSIG